MIQTTLVEKIQEQVRSALDHVITGVKPGGTFARIGDSGSLVFTNGNKNKRKLIGLIRAGDGDDKTDPLFTFVTPIEYVYQDIKAITGATEIRLKR